MIFQRQQYLNALISGIGNGFSSLYLRSFRQIYLTVPNYEIWKSRFPNLTWTHVFSTLTKGRFSVTPIDTQRYTH